MKSEHSNHCRCATSGTSSVLATDAKQANEAAAAGTKSSPNRPGLFGASCYIRRHDIKIGKLDEEINRCEAQHAPSRKNSVGPLEIEKYDGQSTGESKAG